MIQVKGNRFMVTGGAGFIGSHICEELVKQDKEVICIDNFVAGKEENLEPCQHSDKFYFLNLNVSSPMIPSYMKDVDVVFHNAASKCTVCRADPKLDLMTNGYGSLNIFKAAAELGIKVVHASTGSVFGGQPKSYYGASKLAGEAYLSAVSSYHAAFKYVILRYYHVYGPRQDDSPKGGVIPIFIKGIYYDEPITLFDSGQQTRHFTYVKDVVSANFLAANNDDVNGSKFEVVSDLKISIKELAERLYSIQGKSRDKKWIEKPQTPGDIRSFSVSNLAIKKHGFKIMTSFEEGLWNTVEWYESKYEKTL